MKDPRPFIAWALAALVALSTNWVAASLHSTFTLWWTRQPGIVDWQSIIYVVVWLGAIIGLYILRNVFYRPVTREMRTDVAPGARKCLVMFLSNLTLSARVGEAEVAGTTGRWAMFALTDDLDRDLAGTLMIGDKYWSWEMPLRALRHHASALRTVVLVCSPESLDQVTDFVEICNRYHPVSGLAWMLLVGDRDGQPHVIDLNAWTEMADRPYKGYGFEDFDALSDGIGFLLAYLCNHGMQERDIMIDFTGGQKVTSVVAAAMTINRRVRAQYVQTGGKKGVLSYDVVMGSADTPGVGM